MKTNNLLKRTLTGSLYVGLILASLLIHPVLFAIVTTLIACLAMKEFGQLLFKTKFPVYWHIVISFFLLLSILLGYYSSLTQISILPLLMVFIVAQITVIFLKTDSITIYLYTLSFALLYIIAPIYLLNLIHNISLKEGIPYSLSVFILIWVNDTFAYLTGISIGRHKLIERISPKKTWEGFLGGMIMTLAASFILYKFYPSNGLIGWLVFGFLTSLVAVFGDLIESLLKRSANIKDSGKLLPGNGGVLDRIDSLLLVVPVLYIYLVFVLK